MCGVGGVCVFVCTCGVVCGVGGVWVVCVHVVLCVVLVVVVCVCVLCCCVGACVWCVVKLGTLSLSLSLSLALSPSSSLSLSLSLSFSHLSLFFSLLFLFPFSLLLLLLTLVLSLFLLSSLLATKHYGKNRSTNTAANIEAFEFDLAQGKCTAVGSLPPSPLFSPSPPQKKERRLFFRGIFPAKELFCIPVLY